ncbi:helix-turn-helix domain-containing protein [Spirosoma sp. SC4-14]|uniref:helix-turn-helix domain-containing protein n=1 Tax=Spirosoma sp. SC4-14 TaxID=3128900 RepID=UPI0030CFF486
MNATQTIFTSFTPQQLSDFFRDIVRSELDSYGQRLPRRTTLPDYPTKRQAREFLGVSNTTLNNWAKASPQQPARLVPLKIGGRLRYRREDVLAALQEYRQSTSDQEVTYLDQ